MPGASHVEDFKFSSFWPSLTHIVRPAGRRHVWFLVAGWSGWVAGVAGNGWKCLEKAGIDWNRLE